MPKLQSPDRRSLRLRSSVRCLFLPDTLVLLTTRTRQSGRCCSRSALCSLIAQLKPNSAQPGTHFKARVQLAALRRPCPRNTEIRTCGPILYRLITHLGVHSMPRARRSEADSVIFSETHQPSTSHLPTQPCSHQKLTWLCQGYLPFRVWAKSRSVIAAALRPGGPEGRSLRISGNLSSRHVLPRGQP